MLDYLMMPEIWLSFLTLALLEIVLGIDNLVFISVITDRLPKTAARRARRIGLAGALLMRLALLALLSWIIGLKQPLFTLGEFSISWRDLILGLGGLFLLYKGTREIHEEVEGESNAAPVREAGMMLAVFQIMVLDLVFSLDSVITAVGMTTELPVMVAAVVFAMGVMLWAAEPTAAFIRRHPTTKMLALSFLLLVGVALVADALHFHIPRGYLYFAILFSILVETLNHLARRRRRRSRP
ncbi:MAG: TerC family protein [Alphaproteobacteria bacterium]|nr:MAG: TerC family protein [Alphaproteobacteria bacterium]